MRPILLSACLLALPAKADPAADFQRLVETFPSINFTYSPEKQLEDAKAFVASMTGKWVIAGPFLQGQNVFLSSGDLATHCEKQAFTAEPSGSYGFTLTQDGKIEPFVIHMQWAGGTTYAARYDEAGLLTRLFADKIDEMPPDAVFGALLRSPWLGPINLMPVGDDLVYLQAPSAPADVLARCP